MSEPKSAPEPASVRSWPGFIESWVLSRDAPFAIGDLVADMIRHGFGSGPPRERLEAARKLAEEKIRELSNGPPVDSSLARPEAPAARRVTELPSPPDPEVDDRPPAVEPRPAPDVPEQRRSSAMDKDLEGVLARLRQKHAALVKEAEFYARMVREMEGMLGSAPVADEPAAEAAERPARRRTPGRARRREAKGGMTITEAIHEVIADAGRPLTPGEIVPAAARLSGSAEISVRTRITPLAQAGKLVKFDHEGRGFRYGLPAMGGESQP